MRIQLKFTYVKSCDKRTKCSGIYKELKLMIMNSLNYASRKL